MSTNGSMRMSGDYLDERERCIIRTSIVGIIANVFLALLKAMVGIFSNSIAVILDAVNNLSRLFYRNCSRLRSDRLI